MVKSRLSKHVFMFFMGEKRTIGFTGSFRPILIKIKRGINLLPGWYLVNKRAKNKTIIINDYSDLKHLDYDDVFNYRERMLIRYSKLVNQGRRKIGNIKVIYADELWNHLVGERIYVLVLGSYSMFMFVSNYDFLSYYFSFERKIVKRSSRRSMIIVYNDRDLKVSLVVVDGRNVRVPFYQHFILDYEKWLRMKGFVTALIASYLGLIDLYINDPLFDENTKIFETIMSIKRLFEKRS